MVNWHFPLVAHFPLSVGFPFFHLPSHDLSLRFICLSSSSPGSALLVLHCSLETRTKWHHVRILDRIRINSLVTYVKPKATLNLRKCLRGWTTSSMFYCIFWKLARVSDGWSDKPVPAKVRTTTSVTRFAQCHFSYRIRGTWLPSKKGENNRNIRKASNSYHGEGGAESRKLLYRLEFKAWNPFFRKKKEPKLFFP